MTGNEEVETYKRQAAESAADLVESGMVVGLGTGTTAFYALRRIAALIHAGSLRDVVGVATSLATEVEARRLGIPVGDADFVRDIDLDIDGADEVDPGFNLIKGRGGALLREKVVAQSSGRVVIVADETKLSDRLGTQAQLPVEVLQFGWRAHARYVESVVPGCDAPVRRRHNGAVPFITDEGNFILDCAVAPIADPSEVAAALSARAGIAGHGLFLGLTTDLIVAGEQGVVHLTARPARLRR
ncbi:MAG: ribose-5-phosphate isomerase RpiA [Gemmatimonadota bacterium]